MIDRKIYGLVSQIINENFEVDAITQSAFQDAVSADSLGVVCFVANYTSFSTFEKFMKMMNFIDKEDTRFWEQLIINSPNKEIAVHNIKRFLGSDLFSKLRC